MAEQGCIVSGPYGKRCGRPVARAQLCGPCDRALQRLLVSPPIVGRVDPTMSVQQLRDRLP